MHKGRVENCKSGLLSDEKELHMNGREEKNKVLCEVEGMVKRKNCISVTKNKHTDPMYGCVQFNYVFFFFF